MNLNAESLKLHKKMRGKLAVSSKIRLETRRDLSLAYTPGVAEVCRAIIKNKSAIYDYTLKSNAVAVISDGSSVLGLGNIGPEAALPVMEGKAILFKKFADVDAYPICLATQDTEEIIHIIKHIAVGFGGINLEDISAPRCFEIEDRLKRELDIPVMHDDQHGTAIVVLAALINALSIVKKEAVDVHVVINGAGAAAMAIANLLMRYGIQGKHLLMVDSMGILSKDRKDLNQYKEKIANATNPEKWQGGLKEALEGADVFIGVSKANCLKREWIEKMAEDPIVFAMANPDPEISPKEARKTKIKVFGTGRSDLPNQINNVLAFPGVFRGALDAHAKSITEEMKMAAALAIAKLIPKGKRSATNIIPSPLDPRVAKAVANAVKKC